MSDEKDMKWYVARAITGQEKKVKLYIEKEVDRLQLEHFVEQILIPMEKVFEMRNGKKRTREKSFLPGYVLIQCIMDAAVINMIREVPGVIGFLGAKKDDPPIPLRESEVNRILGKVDEAEQAGEQMENPFMVGEQIKVMDGPFSGFAGVIEEVLEDKKKLRVSVKIFGRNTPLELNYLQVERVG